MRWQVGEYVFDANRYRLWVDQHHVVLEPKASELLAYFCQHPDRSIGRDELLESVWHGQIVSDNTISRAVVLLRKALQDDGETREYIATVPKFGYRFIADVAALEKPLVTAHPEGRSVESSRSTGVIRLVALLLVVSLVIALERFATKPVEQPSSAIVPLSRLAVTQSNGHLDSDGRLVYTATEEGRNTVFVVTASGAEPQPISAPGGDADFATWANGGEFVVYQYFNGDRCEIHRVAAADFASRSADVLYRCLPGSFTELSLSPDNSTLYFVERATPFSPYAVFALDLAGRYKRRLSQPVAQGYGNHFVDVHPDTGTLLLLSDRLPGKTSVYTIDAVSDSFILRRTFDYGLDFAIWSHRDGYIVHPSRHPSYQLLESPLGDGASRVVVSDSRRISSPRRIESDDPATADYLFTSYLYNRDIEFQRLPGEQINSAVMDYLPAIATGGDRLAFVSKRSGDSQIWIRDLRSGALLAIEPPDIGRRYHDLKWSSDDTKLLANTNTGLYVYSISQAAITHRVSLPLPAYAAHWHDEQTLGFSHFDGEQWRAYRYSLASGQTEALDSRWAFSLRNESQQLLFDQSLTAYRDNAPLPALRDCARPVWRYQLRYQLDGDAIYCHAADAFNDLLVFDADMRLTRLPDAVSRFEFFSVRNGELARTRVASAHSDIMRTRRSD